MKKRTMIFLAMISCTLWATAFPTLKTLYNMLDIGSDVGVKLLLAGIRFTASGTVILIFASIKNKAFPGLPKGKVRWQVALLGFVQTTMLYVMFYIGLYNSTGVKSAILSQTSVFLVVILAHFIYHDDKLHKGKVIGLILGFLGIIIVNISGLSAAEGIFEFQLTGEGFLLMAGLFTTIGTFYAKGLSKVVNPVILTGWQMLVGGLVLLISGMLTKQQDLVFGSASAYLLLGYLVVISAGAFTLWFVLLQKNKASELSMIKLSIPVLGAIFSAVFIEGEHFTIYIVVALVFVATGIYQCNRVTS